MTTGWTTKQQPNNHRTAERQRNKTNTNTIVGLYGEETDAWRGLKVKLTEAVVDFQGKMTKAIRVLPERLSQPASKPVPSDATNVNAPAEDDVPF